MMGMLTWTRQWPERVGRILSINGACNADMVVV